MSEQSRQPLEETPEVAAAIEDDVSVPQFITGGGPDADTPEFLEPTAGASDPDEDALLQTRPDRTSPDRTGLDPAGPERAG